MPARGKRACRRARRHHGPVHFVVWTAQHTLLLDCRSLEFKLLPLPDNVRLIICNTMVKHELASSAYNERRAQCEAGVRLLAQFYPNIRALRDVTFGQLEQHRRELPEVVYRRCRHVVTENA